MRPFALWVTTLLAVAVPPAPARAAAPAAPAPAPEAPQLEPGAPPLATQRYQNGRRLYAAGDLPGAAAEFRSALTLWPSSPKLAFNLARTLERQGELGEAVGLYRRYLELSPTADDRATVSALATALEARVEAERPRFVISALPEGTEVFLDEVMVGRAPLTVATTPGEHVIRFKAPGHQSVLRTLTAERGKTTPMAVQLERAAPGRETAGEASAEGATGPRSDPAWRVPVAYAALGLGAVGLGLGAYFTAAAAETADEANGLGPGRQARYDALDDRLSGQKAGMGAGYGLGLVGLGAGLALLLWTPDAAPTGEVAR
ncbi:PEGA domain-containing protein [Myxococcota bacterium]|nr:PEGA domain-containing protein [Myxococcota bacterium]